MFFMPGLLRSPKKQQNKMFVDIYKKIKNLNIVHINQAFIKIVVGCAW